MIVRKIGLFFVKHYLRLLVLAVIARHRPKFVVVTGSAGKTTVKFLIYEVLKSKFGKTVAVSPGSLSTKTGIPIALLGFKPEWPNLGPALWQWPWWLLKATLATIYYLLTTNYPKLWVVEFAADLPGDFRFLLSYIKPTVSVVTNVGAAHLEFFKTLEGVAKEKGEIVAALPEGGMAVLNDTDKLVRAMGLRTQVARMYIHEEEGFRFNEAAGRAVGTFFGVAAASANKAIKRFESPAGRFSVIDGKNGTKIIDSSYNANPVSMKLALEELKLLVARSPQQGRRVAVLGDMLELGAAAKKAHRQVGEWAAKAANVVVTVGKGAKLMGGVHFENNEQAAEYLLSHMRIGDIILVKASHGMHFEEIIEVLKK